MEPPEACRGVRDAPQVRARRASGSPPASRSSPRRPRARLQAAGTGTPAAQGRPGRRSRARRGRNFRRTPRAAASRPLVAPPHAARPAAPLAADPCPALGDGPHAVAAPAPRAAWRPSASRRVRLLLRQVVRRQPGGAAPRSEARFLHAGAGAGSGNPGRSGNGASPRAGPPRPRAPSLPAASLEGAAPGALVSASVRWVARGQAFAVSEPL